MSTITKEFTKEQLQQIIETDHVQCGEASSLARIALASLEAEPVADFRYQHLSELYHAQEKRLFKLAQRIKGPSFDKYAHSPSQAIDVLESALFGESADACREAMLQGGNSPVIPNGYVLVPKELTCEMDDAAWGAYHETRCMSDIWASLLAAAPQQEVKP